MRQRDGFAAGVGRFNEIVGSAGLLRGLAEAARKPFHKDALALYLQHEATFEERLNRYRIDELIPVILGQHSPVQDVHSLVRRSLNWSAIQAAIMGHGIIREYLKYLDGKALRQRRGLDQLVYLYCPVDQFGMGDRDQDAEDGLAAASALVGKTITGRRWMETGEFLNADFLALFKTAAGYNILVVEQSYFAPADPSRIRDPQDSRDVYRSMADDMSYMQSKALISPEMFDGTPGNVVLADKMGDYLKAFAYSDKGPSKIVQAMSYVGSFISMLQESQFDLGDNWQATAVAMTNVNVETINVVPKTQSIVKAAHTSYPKTRQSSADLATLRRAVIERMAKAAVDSFDKVEVQIGTKTASTFSLSDMMAARPNKPLILTERLSGLRNPMSPFTQEDARVHLGEAASIIKPGSNMRQAHAALIEHAMNSAILEIVLAGFAGAGKTTAMAKIIAALGPVLKLYGSPRLAVNSGLEGKYLPFTGTDFAIINTDGHVIEKCANALEEHPSRTVLLSGLPTTGLRRDADIAFVSRSEWDEIDNNKKDARAAGRQSVWMPSKSVITPSRHLISGVLASLSYAIRVLLDNGQNKIVATTSIQALRFNQTGKHTTETFRKNLFPRGTARGVPSIETLMEMAALCPNIIIMIDEITGDPAGASLYMEMRRLLLGTFREPFVKEGIPCPFNLKLIIADASLNDANIVSRYLADADPAADRIYIEDAKRGTAEVMSYKQVRKDRLYINANAYPSLDPLTIRYHVSVNPIGTSTDNSTRIALIESQTEYIAGLAEDEMAKPHHEQSIVFLQDKRRIGKLAQRLKNGPLALNDEEILICHSGISPTERSQIPERQKTARIVLMTSSASRGLDFPRTHRIFVEVPGFSIEQNLMEIAQAIFRGRGDGRDAEERSIDFVLGRFVYHDEGAPDASLDDAIRPQAMAALNRMLMVRAAVHTRLTGYGRIGRHKIAMIPCGGKGVEAAGTSLPQQIEGIIRGLNTAILLSGREDLRGHCISLERDVQAAFRDASYRFPGGPATGLLGTHMKRDFGRAFRTVLQTGIGGILTMRPFPVHATALGQMLIEPVEAGGQETYWFQTWEDSEMARIRRMQSTLENIARDIAPNDLRRSIDGIESMLRGIRHALNETRFMERLAKVGTGSRFIAVPTSAYIEPKALASFTPQDDNEFYPRDLMARYIRLYGSNISDIIPRTNDDVYAGRRPFPFIAFVSPYLNNINLQWFSQAHLAATPEFSLLNLLLLAEEQAD